MLKSINGNSVQEAEMIIVAIAWIYVVLMMAATERSITAGVMTFLMYCVVPLSIIVYLSRSRRGNYREKNIEISQKVSNSSQPESSETHSDISTKN